LTEMGNKAFLIILGLLSIIIFILTFLYFMTTETDSQQWNSVLFLVLISITSLVAYLIIHMSGQAHSESLNLGILRYYLIACSVLSLMLAAIRSVYIDFSLTTGFGELLNIFTIQLGSVAPLVLIFAIGDAWIKRSIDSQKPRYIDDSLDSAESEAEKQDKESLGIKGRVALSLAFDSITRRLVGPHAPTVPCPHCLGKIDFNERIEWLGPTALTCSHCGKVVDIIDLLDEE